MEERIQMSSSPAIAWLRLFIFFPPVLDSTAEVQLWFVGRHLECSAKPCGGTMTEITPLPPRGSGAKAGVWALISWLFGSSTHVTFSA